MYARWRGLGHFRNEHYLAKPLYAQLVHSAGGRRPNFYAALGNPEIMGPDFCPFHTALATGNPSSSTLQTADIKYFQVHVAPLPGAASDQAALVATVSDITAEILQQQKLAAIHQAGRS